MESRGKKREKRRWRNARLIKPADIALHAVTFSWRFDILEDGKKSHCYSLVLTAAGGLSDRSHRWCRADGAATSSRCHSMPPEREPALLGHVRTRNRDCNAALQRANTFLRLPDGPGQLRPRTTQGLLVKKKDYGWPHRAGLSSAAPRYELGDAIGTTRQARIYFQPCSQGQLKSWTVDVEIATLRMTVCTY